MIEFEAGLAEGPRTATTPLDMIWHTKKGGEREENRVGVVVVGVKQMFSTYSN